VSHPPTSRASRLGALAGVAVSLVSFLARADWQPPDIRLPVVVPHPILACTSQELARLRTAWKGEGAEHKVVAGRVSRADRALAQHVDFPPRGGQHNTWYQCGKCQTALKTLDRTQHQCPLCKRVYSGPPYDDVLFKHRHGHLLNRMHDAAWAYAVTEQERYATDAAQILLGYADRYLAYPLHANTRWNLAWRWVAGGRLYEQTLSEASAMATAIAPGYDLIHGSDVLTEADHRHIRNELIRPMLRNIDKYKAGVNNWQTWHNAAMFCAGVVLHDETWMRRAVYGGGGRWWTPALSWIVNHDTRHMNDGNGFLFQMSKSVTPDGFWYEGSWGYHFYALKALVHTAEPARRVGIDLWNCPGLRNMFILPARHAMPDGSLPRFADDVNSSVRRHTRLMEPAYKAYGDPAILALLPSSPTFESILLGRDARNTAPPAALKSVVFPRSGHAILRSAGLAAAVTFGKHGGYHSHFDKLSFVFFGHGRELGVDPGRARSQAYSLPIHKHWYKATVAHNTVVVNGTSQRGTAGRLEMFGHNARFAACAASCDEGYRGVVHWRALVLSDRYLLVIDDLQARRTKDFLWLYHNRGAPAQCSLADQETDLEGRLEGGEYIANARTGRTQGAIRVTFPGDTITNHLLVAAQGESTVTVGNGVGASVTDRVPLAMVARSGRRVQFVAVLEPIAGQDRATVQDLRVSVEDPAMVITVDQGSHADRIRVTEGRELHVTRDDEPLLTVRKAAP